MKMGNGPELSEIRGLGRDCLGVSVVQFGF